MTETVTITTKQDFINFLTSCISVSKADAGSGEQIKITLQTDKNINVNDGVTISPWNISIYFRFYCNNWQDERGQIRFDGTKTEPISAYTFTPSSGHSCVLDYDETAQSWVELLQSGFSFSTSFDTSGTVTPWIQIIGMNSNDNTSDGYSYYNSALQIDQSFPLSFVVDDVLHQPVQLSTKQEIIDFIYEHWLLPPTGLTKQVFNQQIYSDSPIEWVGSGDFPLKEITFNIWHIVDGNIVPSISKGKLGGAGYYDNRPWYMVSPDLSIKFASGLAPPYSIDNDLNDLLTSSDISDPTKCFGSVTVANNNNNSFDTAGTYTIYLRLMFSDDTEEFLSKSIVLERNIIATASSNVNGGRSCSVSMDLEDCGVYDGTINLENNTITMDCNNHKFWLDPDDCNLNDYNNSYNYLPLIAMPYDVCSQFEEDYIIHYDENNANIDSTSGLEYLITDNDDELIKFNVGEYVLYLCYTNEESLTFDETLVNMNGTDYPFIKVDEAPSLTNSLTYQNNHTRQDLIPGYTYQINGVYSGTEHYNRCEGIGQLQMLKCPTTTTISTNNTNITLGDVVTLSVSVTERQYNTSLGDGFVNIYDNNTLVSSNNRITGNITQITLTPTLVGVHNITATYTSYNIRYNNSNSNSLTVVVNKKPSSISTQSGLSFYLADGGTITGTLTSGSNTLSDHNLKLVDYANVTVQTTFTDSNGQFTFTYNPSDRNNDGRNLTILFEGTNEYETCSATIPVTILRHNVTMTVPSVTGYTDDSVDIPITLVDENSNPVTNGTVNVDLLEYKEFEITNITSTSEGNGYWKLEIDSTDLTTEDIDTIDYFQEYIVDKTQGNYYNTTGFIEVLTYNTPFYLYISKDSRDWVDVNSIPSQVYEIDIDEELKQEVGSGLNKNMSYKFIYTVNDTVIENDNS